jgi:hypothetical protein
MPHQDYGIFEIISKLIHNKEGPGRTTGFFLVILNIIPGIVFLFIFNGVP